MTRLLGRPRTPLQYAFYGALYLACPILALYGLYWLDQPYQLDDQYLVSEGEFVVSFAESPPATGWQTLNPERPPVRGPKDPFTSVWYRFKNPRLHQLSALYVPFPKANLDIWYQGERLKLLGPMALPLFYSRSPLLIPLSAEPSGTQRSMVYVRVARHGIGTWLPYTYVAPYDAAERDYSSQRFITSWLSIGILCVMSVFAAFIFGFFLLNKKETAYGWFSLTVLLWGLHTAHALVDKIPFHHPLWFALGYLSLWWVVVELVFINRFFSIPAPRLEKFVAGVTAAISAVLVAISLNPPIGPVTWFAGLVFEPWILICSVIVTVRYFVAIRVSWTYESVSLWLTSGVFLGVAIRDILFEFVPGGLIPGNVFYLQYVALLPISLFGWHLVRRFAAALNVARLRNRELDAKVAERTAELEQSYKKVAVEENKRSIAEERARLMRDMHDGLGGQLVHALALSEQGGDYELQKALRLALDDLRLVVDSLSPEQRGLNGLLASYRHRVSKLLARTGTNVSWDLADLEAHIALGPRQALNVLRIVQEAVTNAVRHSGCDFLQIELEEVNNQVQLRVVDNGRGLSEKSIGRGLQNMRARAREIGAQLKIDSSDDGAAITLVLPRH